MEQEQVVEKPVKRRKGMRASIYILPNMITTASLFCGFLSMKMGFEARLAPSHELAMQSFVYAAYLILIAGVCDGLDGSVARWTRTQSAFGVQLDSLCDLVSFGVAPALLAYNFALSNLSRLGLGVAFVFAAAGALRLARFNVQASVGKSSGNFTGIPIPMAAAPVAVYILAQDSLWGWLADEGAAHWKRVMAATLTATQVNAWVMFGIMLMLALGMVSTFEYISTKTIRLPKRHPFRVFAVVLMALILLISIDLTVTLAVLMLAYCMHGPVLWFFFKRDRAEDEDELFAAPEEEEEESEG
jgi:CDP-diacylglycerol--serine O-phosphatidyltransferase